MTKMIKLRIKRLVKLFLYALKPLPFDEKKAALERSRRKYYSDPVWRKIVDHYHPGELFLNDPDPIPPERYKKAGERYDYMLLAHANGWIGFENRGWDTRVYVTDKHGNEVYDLGWIDD